MTVRRAFTLIELLVVMGLIALLMSVVMPVGSRFVKNMQKGIEESKKRREFDEKKYEAFIKDRADLEENIKRFGIAI